MTTTTIEPACPRIAATATALPEHYATQDQIIEALKAHWAKTHFNVDRIEALHRNTLVSGRHLALPLAAYAQLTSFKERNDAWIDASTQLAERVARDAITKAGLQPRDIDHVFFVSVTGIATPSIDARLVNRIGFRDDIKRTPIFGLGCVAGASGLARAADHLRAFPNQHALLISVELCSLTIQQQDTSMANIIASGLFGDGAAAVVLSSNDGPGPVVERSIAKFFPNTERVMGWDVVDTGFKIVLSGQVPAIARSLDLRGLPPIDHWLVHTGGPKVLEAFQDAFGLSKEQLRHSYGSLNSVGNLSSASVLFVLDAQLKEETKGRGLLMALGPGFCAELCLLRW